MNKFKFSKVCGAGNDFIVVDNREQTFPLDKKNIIKLCDRKRSVGADGLMLVDKVNDRGFSMRIFNADGSEAEMCGNGARCIAWFAYSNQIAPENMLIDTIAGEIKAKIIKDELVELTMSDPYEVKTKYKIKVDGETIEVNSINTGVPHVVVLVDNIELVDVVGLGSRIRYHEVFKPAGTNVNFISIIGQDTIAIRTYERGVEDETLACGTGAVAASLISFLLGKTGSDVQLKTKEKDTLSVAFKYLEGTFKDVYLKGPAEITYTGLVAI